MRQGSYDAVWDSPSLPGMDCPVATSSGISLGQKIRVIIAGFVAWFGWSLGSDSSQTVKQEDASDPSDGSVPGVPYPGDDPTVAPGEGFEWRGKGEPGSAKGNWYNPETGEWYHPNLKHPEPIGPHWDYHDPNGGEWRVYPDGRVEPKS